MPLQTRGLIKIGHAKAVLGLDTQTAQSQLTHTIIREKWSVRRAEEEARRIRCGSNPKKKPLVPSKKSPDVLRLETELSSIVGSPVEIREEEGALVIDYARNLDVLSGIMERLGYRG